MGPHCPAGQIKRLGGIWAGAKGMCEQAISLVCLCWCMLVAGGDEEAKVCGARTLSIVVHAMCQARVMGWVGVQAGVNMMPDSREHRIDQYFQPRGRADHTHPKGSGLHIQPQQQQHQPKQCNNMLSEAVDLIRRHPLFNQFEQETAQHR